MEFYEHMSHFDAAVRLTELQKDKQAARHLRNQGYRSYYDRVLRAAEAFTERASVGDATSTAVRSYLAELYWYNIGRPSIKLFDDYVDMFSDVDVSVPLAELSLPFGVFVIRLPKSEPMTRLVDGQQIRLRSITVMCQLMPTDEHTTGHRSVDEAALLLFGEPPAEWRRYEDYDRRFQFNANYIECKDGQPALDDYGMEKNVIHAFSLRDNGKPRDLEKELEEVKPDRSLGDTGATDALMYHTMRLCVRLACATAMLAVGSEELIEPDVLRADAQAYTRACAEGRRDEVERLAARAFAKRGGRDYAVGLSDYLLGRRSFRVDTSVTHSDDGRPLRYRHVRRAHFHTVRYGKGRELRKRQFFPMIIVRPDLPPAPDDVRRNYRVTVASAASAEASSEVGDATRNETHNDTNGQESSTCT